MTSLRVFVNAAPVDVEAGATALDCVRAWKSDEGDAVKNGARVITDSRGLPIAMESVAQPGSIYRTVSNRASERGE